MGKITATGIGSSVGSDDCTAGKAQVLAGYTAVTSDSDDESVEGTMPNNGEQSATLKCGQSKQIPAGYTPGGTVTAADLTSQTGATAAANQISSGKTAWVNGQKVTGTLTERGQYQSGGAAFTGSYFAVNSLPEGIYRKNGASWAPEARCTADQLRNTLGITAGKIKKGEVIAGVTGTWEGYVANPTDLYYKGSNPAGFYVSNNGGGYCSASFDGVYITVTSTTTGASGLTITAGRTYNLSGYSRLIIELNVIKAPPYRDTNGGLFFKNGSEELGRLWADGLFYPIGAKTYSFDLSNVQKVVTPSLVFTPRTAAIQITRIRLA